MILFWFYMYIVLIFKVHSNSKRILLIRSLVALAGLIFRDKQAIGKLRFTNKSVYKLIFSDG